MNEKAVLETIRKYALWAVLGSAALLLILEILKAWEVIKTTTAGSIDGLEEAAMAAMAGGGLGALGALQFSPPSANAWGHVEETLGIILALGLVMLLAILVSSRTKLGKGAKAATAPARAAAPAATAKAATANKAPARPKK
jgi:hypothetical protein